jgi:hypothetical protein
MRSPASPHDGGPRAAAATSEKPPQTAKKLDAHLVLIRLKERILDAEEHHQVRQTVDDGDHELEVLHLVLRDVESCETPAGIERERGINMDGWIDRSIDRRFF